MRPVELHHTDTGGDGEVVLLAHAIGCDLGLWDELVPRLADRFRVVACDARGHGRSPVPRRPYTLELMADDACALLDRLGVARAHWVGLSMGGMVGLAFALRHPGRLRRLVVANSTASFGAEGPALWRQRIKAVESGGLAALREALTARWFSEDFRSRRPEAVSGLMDRFVAGHAEGYLGCCDAIAKLDYTDDLVRVRAKTLVVAGERDAGTPPAMSEEMARRIPGARLEVIAGAAHLSVVEKPAEFAACVGNFLAAS